MSFLEFLLLKYSSTMVACPLMIANMRGVKPAVVGRVKSFRPCNKQNLWNVKNWSLLLLERNSLHWHRGRIKNIYIGIEGECSEEFKIAGPACHVEEWGASWSWDWTIRWSEKINILDRVIVRLNNQLNNSSSTWSERSDQIIRIDDHIRWQYDHLIRRK